MAGSGAGAVLQLQQAALWPWPAYAGMVASALIGASTWRWLRRFRLGALPLAGLMSAVAGAGLAGWRAAAYVGDAMHPAMEGLDLWVTGVVAQMPQRSESGLRFTFEVESARWAD